MGLSRISGTQAVRKERSGVIARFAWRRGRGVEEKRWEISVGGETIN